MTLSELRMEICQGCEHYTGILKICKLCKCFMPAKTMIAGQSCPAEPPKWLAVSDVINNNNCCNKDPQ